MKNIFKALFAFAALVMVGCTQDQTYTPGSDLAGEQIYIDNVTSTFNVQTAEDKQKEAEALKPLSRGLQKEESFTDDTEVDVKIVRKGSSLAQFDFEVKLTMLAEDATLFTLPDGAIQTGADQNAKTVVYTVPCSFSEDASETVLRIGFDIAELEDNVDYDFTAELADLANSSNYGADKLDFTIVHSLPIELPFEDIGLVTLEETFFRDMLGVPTTPYSDCIIQIHKDDKKAIDDAKAAGEAPEFAAGYVRFYVPHFMYQIAAASVAAGDGAFEEEELDYYAQGCGLMLCMTPNYEFVAADLANDYPHPLKPAAAKTGYPRSPVVFIDSVDGAVYHYNFTFGKVYMGTIPLNVSGMGVFDIVLFDPSLGYSLPSSRSMNTYTLNTSFFLSSSGNLWDAPINITWDKNTLEDDWANYFTIDFNNDIDYGVVGEGVFTSKYQGNFATKTLYTGLESVSGDTVYYVENPYGTSTAETGNLGLALTWNGTTAKVAEKQPLNMQWNGRELYASQSEKINSAVEFDENGAVKKVTFGVAIVNEEGAVLGDYAETFDFESEGNINYFLGQFYMQLLIFKDGSPVFSPTIQQLNPGIASYYSPVTITRASNDSNDVIIEGLIPEDILAQYGKYADEEGAGYFSTAVPMKEVEDTENPGTMIQVPVPMEDRPALPQLAAGGTVKGTYDPVTNTVVIPAQYFYKPEYVVGGTTFFPYFQPCTMDYGYDYTNKNDPTTYYWYSYLDTTADEVALHFDQEQGMLYMGKSTMCPDEAFTYAVDLYAYVPSYDEFVYTDQALFVPFTEPLMIGNGGVAPLSVAPKSSFMKKGISAKSVTMGHKSERKEVVRIPKAYPFR